MQTVLLAPIHLDALYVKEGRRVCQPMADFTRLPYFDGKRDVGASVAWLSEEIVAEPFQDEHFFLDQGIHLHWSFPQALTRAIYRGSDNEQQSSFAPLPNRWLVMKGREINGKVTIEKQWVVESDYLWPNEPPGKETPRHYVAYPNWEGHEPGSAYRPFRRIGRVLSLNDWLARGGSQAEYLREPLTSVGYGEPGFAAFYPACHSVFGFYDPEFDEKSLADLHYQVLGWYATREQDYLQILLAHARAQKPGQAPQDRMELVLKEKLRWSIKGEKPTDAIIACHGRVTFRPQGDPLRTPELESPMLTFGATASEALSSYLALKIAKDLKPDASEEDCAKKKAEIEDQLEAVLLAPQLDHRQLDLAAKFREARHAKGFVAVDAGILWAVRPTTGAQSTDSQDLKKAALWPNVAAPLAELNRLQKAYNEAWDEIQTARRQLFSDWYKYMLCAYPPENAEADYPKIAQVRFYIEHHSLPALERKIARAGKLEPCDGSQSTLPRKASADSRDYSLARRIEQSLAAVLKAIADHPKTPQQPQYALQPVAAPRFWRPSEPVVLMTGGMANGEDWRERREPLDKDGLLPCQRITIPGETLGDVAREICEAVKSVECPLSRTWTRQPWRPFLLHWEVELAPFKYLSNLARKSRDYHPQLVTRNFTLKRSDVDLTPRTAKPALAKGALSYTGSSMLTPQVVDPYVTRLKDYLDQARNEPKPAKGDRSPLNEETRECLERALQKLTKDFFCLAQSLSGFNDALLMHKQTLQLPIADPIGFADSRQLAARVAKDVDQQVFSAPHPFDDFSPIRTGELRSQRMRLIDTFGRIKDFECCACCSATPMPARECNGRAAILLPPRIVQPARLNFRFLASEQDAREMNSHPASTPICGWAMANHADQSLFFYDGEGLALGSLETDDSIRVRWRSAPGRSVGGQQAAIIQLDQIGNSYLRRMVAFFLGGSKDYFLRFLTDLKNAQMKIEPELAGDAFLMGQPLALVRATLSLELQGPPAAHQGWNAFRQNMTRRRLKDDKFTGVQFPFRLGEQDQLNDGLTVYWLEDEKGGYQENAYIIPNYDEAASAKDKKCDFLYQSVEAPPLQVTMLIDPRAMVHATMGVLPIKAIQIPPHLYADALKRIEMTFLAAPLLVERRRPDSPKEIALPIADPPGYHWSWVEKHGQEWVPMPIKSGGLYTPFVGAVEAREGWLKLTRAKENSEGDGKK